MMTTQVARVVQACFTRCMNTRTRSHEDIYDKAKRILSDPARVTTSEGSRAPHWWTGTVVGDHGTYSVAAISPEMITKIDMGEHTGRVCCLRCKASARGKLCSHAIIAEEMRLRGEDS